MLYAVSIYMLLISEKPDLVEQIFIFDDEEKARAFLKKDFEEELRIQEEENQADCRSDFTPDFAQIVWDGAYRRMFWMVTCATDMRGDEDVD